MRTTTLLFCLFVAAGLLHAGYAQEPPASDSLWLEYDLQEIVVRGETPVEEQTTTVQRLSTADLAPLAALSADRIVRFLPAAHVQTNSRGETLLFLRNAGERQTAIFFDGALLNIPWDNRLDLGLIPAGIISGMTVTKGAPAIEYGANVMGGAVNLRSPMLSYEGRFTEAAVAYGTADAFRTTLTHRGRSGAFSYTGSFGYVRQDGLPLPADAHLAYNQPDTDLRTNTDRRIANGFVRGLYTFEDGTRLSLSVLHIDAEQGVAPEGHIPPEDARLWRYPLWRYTVGILSGEGYLTPRTHWKATVWTGGFTQHIDAYGSLAFDRPVEREEDDDLTLGTRLALAQTLGPGTLRLAVNGFVATHRQRDLELGDDGRPRPGETFPRLTYRQETISLGTAYEWPVTDRFQTTFSAGYDVMRMPRTGDKPARDPFSDYSFSAGARYDFGDGFFARATLGRKTRFPTMRELFGEALNRFLLNPDLRPESALLAEVGLGLARSDLRLEVIPFLNRTSDTIDRINVTVDGQRKRQRINLRGSRVLGVEMNVQARLHRHVQGTASLTLMDVKRLKDAPDESERLAEKPDAVGTAALRYAGPQGLSVQLDATYLGHAYSLDEDNTFVPLPRALAVGARLGYRLDDLVPGFTAELFARGDNLTDETIMTQLGLPGAGRTLQAGVEMSF
ncbi:MAG: TonB-dependent receptor [Bacteroidetes bacterium]|nr:MAG: TonB-dependent receptor [Bacteroidota bacterium]